MGRGGGAVYLCAREVGWGGDGTDAWMVWDQRRWKEKKRAEVEFKIFTSVREERKKRTEMVEWGRAIEG